MDQNIGDIIKEIKDVSTAVLKKDVAKVKGFSERQVKAIAEQALKVQKAALNGDLDADLEAFFKANITDMAKNFANTLKGIISVTIEKLWNAIVDALWKGVKTALG